MPAGNGTLQALWAFSRTQEEVNEPQLLAPTPVTSKDTGGQAKEEGEKSPSQVEMIRAMGKAGRKPTRNYSNPPRAAWAPQIFCCAQGTSVIAGILPRGGTTRTHSPLSPQQPGSASSPSAVPPFFLSPPFLRLPLLHPPPLLSESHKLGPSCAVLPAGFTSQRMPPDSQALFPRRSTDGTRRWVTGLP